MALARALIADPAVLLLNDCTSALDAETEARVRSAIAELRPGRTSLIVSHKPASVRCADLILVLDGGQIVERGTHAELLARGGYYARLHDSQAHSPSERDSDAALGGLGIVDSALNRRSRFREFEPPGEPSHPTRQGPRIPSITKGH